ncbi:RsmB/NOP family class I SAM-dependent RNA methyltransferase [Sphingorhabdus sp. YGSMI21]|uniref:RsmB/NOP family class I SAM-dependent RNA methyltransferase n=1 Tax=Sphingorhabdus sp. YGSMI21 TaxID=2077182 RepID=UPI000C1F6281|nr:RsmB/NOP family class I SAM-dependent RNA methyltransferase [Sphingorhabdus sp. YGSMI21]ATW05137.1 RNA methyltransferase [Sphingorhabdus sp. YGSMI21]
MTPAARLQAAIEMLDWIIAAARDNGASADNIAKKFFKERRYAGSGDRRAIRELVYSAIRRWGDRPESGRQAMLGLVSEQPELRELFSGSNYGPAAIEEGEPVASGAQIPDWLTDRFAGLIDEDERKALFDRAPLHVRVNGQRSTEAEVRSAWPEAVPLALPHGYELPAGSQLEDKALFREGAIEIQDLGSQAIAMAGAASKPELVLDLCAGAGGKTLALAAMLPDESKIIAADTDRNRLSRIEPRKRRASARNIETILLGPGKEMESLEHLKGRCDLVLIDAPCSGTGTWRRNPELRWRMTAKRLEHTTELQQRLFALGSELVKPGGRLVYAVCSLLDAEGGDQTDSFLESHPGWREISIDLPIGRPYRKGLLLSPHHDGTDGFYFTCLEKL